MSYAIIGFGKIAPCCIARFRIPLRNARQARRPSMHKKCSLS